MDGYSRRNGLAIVLGAALLSVAAVTIAYNIGVSQGLAQAAVAAAADGRSLPPFAYGWYRPWGIGFGFPVFLLLFLWIVLLRGLWWGGPWWRYRSASYPHPMASAIEEWHRRAHEDMKAGPSADDSGRRG